MNYRNAGFVVAVCLGAALSSAASAQAPVPSVLIHSDDGTVVSKGVAAHTGSSVGANPGDVISVHGNATATYANGCVVKIPAGSYTVPSTPPTCAGTVTKLDGDGLYVAGGLGALALVGVALGGGGGSSKPSSP